VQVQTLHLIFRMLWFPRASLRALPRGRFLITAYLVYVLFVIGRAYQLKLYSLEVSPSPTVSLIFIGFVIFGGAGASLMVFGLLGQGLLWLFRRRLALVEAMNVLGYAQAPRLLLLVVFVLGYNLLPGEWRAFLRYSDAWPVQAALLLGYYGLIGYSWFLSVYGLFLCSRPLTADPAR
jgi:hypothetical protein